MAIESTCLPVIIPSEVFLITYGAAALKGGMNIYLVIFSASVGILIGSFVNYYMAAWLGRTFLYKYGKYIMLTQKKILYWEKKFLKYSKFIVFVGRFVPIPAVKHLVTIPAGLSRMDVKVFTFLTTSGGAIFSTLVVLFGYWFGKKVAQDDFMMFMNRAMLYMILFTLTPMIAYKVYEKLLKL